MPLSEDPDERRSFDYGVETYGGNNVRWIAIALGNWAVIERRIHPGGSFGEQLAIMSNELHAEADKKPQSSLAKRERGE